MLVRFRLGNVTETRPVHGKLDHHVSAGRKRDGFKQRHVSVEFTKYGNTLFRPVFDMEMIFHSHANKTHFHKKGYALGLILKVKVLELGSGLLLRDKTSPIETGILYIWLGEVEISSVEACYRIAVIQVWEEFTIFEYKG